MPAFFDAAGLGKQDSLVAWQPKAMVGISALAGSQPIETWKDYFAFHGTTLNGTPEQSPRWKRAVGAVNTGLGEAVGKIYVQRHFSAQTKARADELVANLIAAFDKRIDKLDWMDPATKSRAKAKLAGMYRTETVRNLDAWCAAFDVKPGQARYLPPNKRVHVW